LPVLFLSRKSWVGGTREIINNTMKIQKRKHSKSGVAVGANTSTAIIFALFFCQINWSVNPKEKKSVKHKDTFFFGG